MTDGSPAAAAPPASGTTPQPPAQQADKAARVSEAAKHWKVLLEALHKQARLEVHNQNDDHEQWKSKGIKHKLVAGNLDRWKIISPSHGRYSDNVPKAFCLDWHSKSAFSVAVPVSLRQPGQHAFVEIADTPLTPDQQKQQMLSQIGIKWHGTSPEPPSLPKPAIRRALCDPGTRYNLYQLDNQPLNPNADTPISNETVQDLLQNHDGVDLQVLMYCCPAHLPLEWNKEKLEREVLPEGFKWILKKKHSDSSQLMQVGLQMN
jgi:hypothetical protein